ncbi:mucin-associated surface protein (MASP) [Trypanosoma cruzi]|nr:mucin-associated surface protein (MASP) [Trypanosoma cruzi]
MAMMMTGRVLLVCALCVLWCGAAGRCDGEETAAHGGGELLVRSQEIVTSPEGSQGLKGGVTVVTENVIPESSPPKEDEEDDDEDGIGEDEESDESAGTKEDEESIEGQSDKEGKAAPDPGSGERNLSGSRQEKNQAIVPAGGISPPGSQESKANSTQTEVEGKKDADKRPP